MSKSEQETINNHRELTEVLRKLRLVSPAIRGDFVACELMGMKRAERAVERGVEPATVSQNVADARKRLDELTSVNMESFRVHHNLTHAQQ